MKINSDNRKMFFLVTILIFVMMIGSLPYINVFLLDKIVIIYASLLFISIFPVNYLLFFLTSVIFLVLALLATLLKLTSYAEILGVIVYFFIWLSFACRVQKMISELKGNERRR